MLQDVSLAAIFRDYLAQGRQLPGVRTGHEPLAWPSTNAARTASASAPNNGGDYVASRRALLNQYVARWLLALHDEDVNVYAKMVYGICADLVDDTLVDNTHLLGAKDIAAEKVRKPSIYPDCPLTFLNRKRKYLALILSCEGLSNYIKTMSHSLLSMTYS